VEHSGLKKFACRLDELFADGLIFFGLGARGMDDRCGWSPLLLLGRAAPAGNGCEGENGKYQGDDECSGGGGSWLVRSFPIAHDALRTHRNRKRSRQVLLAEVGAIVAAALTEVNLRWRVVATDAETTVENRNP
jgi:hypothetical protein